MLMLILKQACIDQRAERQRQWCCAAMLSEAEKLSFFEKSTD